MTSSAPSAATVRSGFLPDRECAQSGRWGTSEDRSSPQRPLPPVEPPSWRDRARESSASTVWSRRRSMWSFPRTVQTPSGRLPVAMPGRRLSRGAWRRRGDPGTTARASSAPARGKRSRRCRGPSPSRAECCPSPASAPRTSCWGGSLRLRLRKECRARRVDLSSSRSSVHHGCHAGSFSVIPGSLAEDDAASMWSVLQTGSAPACRTGSTRYVNKCVDDLVADMGVTETPGPPGLPRGHNRLHTCSYLRAADPTPSSTRPTSVP